MNNSTLSPVRKSYAETEYKTVLRKLDNCQGGYDHKVLVQAQRICEMIQCARKVECQNHDKNKLDYFAMETEAAMRRLEKGPLRFEIELFKGNILFNTKREKEAVVVYKGLIDKYPQLSKENNVAMSIVVAYEELEEFGSAIELLNIMRPDYPDAEFLDLKITRLKDRKANLPGAKGLRK